MADARSATCPRCKGPVSLRYGEKVCVLGCGIDLSEKRAGDAIEENSPVRDREAAPRTGRKWTEDDVRFFMANKDEMSAREIGQHLDRTGRGIATWAYKRQLRKRRVSTTTEMKQMGEVLQSPRRRWGEHEGVRLEDYARPGQLRAIAERLKRSHNAARVRLWRMGLRARENDGMLSACEVADLYGCDKGKVIRLIELEILPAERSGRFWRIDPGDAEEAAPWLTSKGRGGRPRKGTE